MNDEITQSKEKIFALNAKLSLFLNKLRKSENDDIVDLLNQIFGKEGEDDENDGDGKERKSIANSQNNSIKLNTSDKNGSQTNISNRISQAITKNQNVSRRANNIKIKNRRSKNAIGFGKAWAYYVDKICNSRYVRDLINLEQEEVAVFMYDTLTKIEKTSEDGYNLESIKKFISNAIDYSCDCENDTWTVYLVIFVFKLFGNILKICEQKLTKRDQLSERVIMKINSNILDIMDTLRNSNYIFGVLSEEDDKNRFKDEVFMITLYFLNKLLTIRTKSMQQKLEGILKNHSGSQIFFNSINQYLKTFTTKINKSILRQFYSKQKYKDELSLKSYYTDKNLEKQIIDFLRLVCKNGNTYMQNYLKRQKYNTRSFNLIYVINDISVELLTHLHYPVAFDTFIS